MEQIEINVTKNIEEVEINVQPNVTQVIISEINGGGGGVESVTGNIVDNTDPANPTVNFNAGDYDLADFTNTSNDPFVRESELPSPTVPTLQEVLQQGNESNIPLQFSETSQVIFAEDEFGNQMTLSTDFFQILYNDLSQISLNGGEIGLETTLIPNSAVTFGVVSPSGSPVTYAYGVSQIWVGGVGTRYLNIVMTDPGVVGRKNLFTPALSQDETIATREWVQANAATREVKVVTGTTYTLVEEDANKILHFTSNTDVTITIPTGLSATNRYEGKQLGDGQLIFGTDIGVDLRVGASELAKTAEKYSVFGLDVIGTEEYMLYGKLELS